MPATLAVLCSASLITASSPTFTVTALCVSLTMLRSASAVLPAVSAVVAVTVNAPSLRDVKSSELLCQVPSAKIIACPVTEPLPSETVMLTILPSSILAL